MSHRKPYLILAIFVTLAVVTLSCGIGGSTAPAPTPTSVAAQPAAKEEAPSEVNTAVPEPSPTPQPTPAPQGASAEPILTLDKTQFQPGEEIQVAFTAPDTWPTDAWVGIIPSDIPHGDEVQNDEYDLSYQYLEGKTSGTLIFVAPDAPGTYDFRLHDTDTEGKEWASVSFVVTAPEEPTEAVEEAPADYDTPFPLPDDVQQYLDLSGDGLSLNFQTSMTLDETVEFYQQALSDMGLTERPLLTVVEESVFSMVYDTWEDGRAVVVQGVDLGDTTNVNIRLENN